MKIDTAKNTKVLTGIYLFVIATGLLLNGCSKSGEDGGRQPAGGMVVNVVGFKTEQKNLSESISVVGTLEANQSVNIMTEVNGMIESINFEEGQKVSQGDVLFQIEKNKLKAGYDQAAANLKLAETTAARYENLVKSKAVSRQEYDERVATLESSKATAELTKEQLEDATIIAPFDGVMGERLVSRGQFISQGMQLTYLFNQDPIKVAFHVPERFLGDVKIGQVINMSVASYKDKTYEGEVYFISPKINEVTRTALVKAYTDNSTGELREGMFASIDLIVSVSKDALVIPETALIVKGDDVFVFVVKGDETVEMRSVQTGKRVKGMVVIPEGLKEGEIVVTEGYQKIGPGSKVKVRFENPSAKKVYEII